MINLIYPTGKKLNLNNTILISFDYQWSGSYIRDVEGRKIVSSFNECYFAVNVDANGALIGPPPSLFRMESLNFDTLEQRSNRFDYLNLYDTVNSSDLPMLSSGRYEQPCHHESATGTININPSMDNKVYNLERNKLYPMSFSMLDTSYREDGGDGYTHVSTVEGTALGEVVRATDSNGWISKPYLKPRCWLTMTCKHYKWQDPVKGKGLTLEQAQSRGIVKEETSICNSRYIKVPNLPYLYFSDCRLGDRRKLVQHNEVFFGASYSRLSSYTAGNSYDLPNIDYLKLQLGRDIPGLFQDVRMKISYRDEIWYNLILAGAKEIKRLDMNNIANLLEIPGMIRIFDRIYKQFITFKNGSKVYKNPTTGKIIKKAACIYLGLHYGIKLTVMDIKDIVETFRDNPSLLRQLRRRVVSYSKTMSDGCTYNCKSCMAPKAGREITDIRDLSRILGLELSALNLWDLVPWSFVVDWFIPMSDILDSFENIARLESTYNLEYLIETVSRSDSVTWKGHTLQIKIYDRYITDHMPEFGFTVGEASGLNNHVIEASALVINSVR